MVAAGATALMAASEGNSSKGADNVQTRYDAQHAQRSSDGSSKRTVKVEKKNSVRSPTSNKTGACIRETKASRLRAASIVSPTEGTPLSRKSAIAESLCPWNVQTGTSLPRKPKSPMSSSSRIPTCATREKDKTVKRSSILTKSPEADEKRPQHATYYEKTSERVRTRRQTAKQTSSSSSSSSSSRHDTTAAAARKLDIHQQSTGFSTMGHASSAIASSSGMKTRSSTQRSSSASGGHDNSEVLRRVDALTALTRATMERVERLASNSSPSVNGGSRVSDSEIRSSGASATAEKNGSSSSSSLKKPSKKTIAQSTNSVSSETARSNSNDEASEANFLTRQSYKRPQPPISILKHKTTDPDVSLSGNSPYATASSSSTVVPALIVQQFTKKHGILKKRSSFDDNEILRRRRSCSPDVAYMERIEGADFKPILKNERRSSLDELIKRSRSPELQPTSILKRKSSGEEDREDGQFGSSEPTSILKRSSGNSGKSCGVGHHVSIAAAVAKTLGCMPDSMNGSEVRPILKKKFSREESLSSDPPSLEPRPILKKKSSTDSDEHDEKPKKTILKSSRKSSQEDSSNENDGASPKKLSMLKNRSIQRRTNSLPECDVVRPILKQSSSRESSSTSRSSLSGTASPGEASIETSKDLFLRKRARSVGHMQSSLNGREDWLQTESTLRLGNASILLTSIDRNPRQNITSPRSNESTATSSIAPIVSFKLPSREEMENRYDECCSLDNQSTADEPSNYPEFRHNFEGCRLNDEDDGNDNGNPNSRDYNDDDDDEDDDDEANDQVDYNEGYNCNIDGAFPSRDRSSQRRNDWDSRIFRKESSHSTTQRSHFASVSSNSEASKGQSANGDESANSEDKKIASTYTAERRTNVSEIAQRFKALESQVTVTVTDSRTGRKLRSSTQKYGRDASEQHKSDRFSTQPVTSAEVREAVLQNQRNAAATNDYESNSSHDNGEEKMHDKGDIDPSKLSLADRVRLFNRRIATESIGKAGVSIERSQRRGPANRYKTQPITLEEVEVATRSFPAESSAASSSDSGESERRDQSTRISHAKQPLSNNVVPPPRSILKYSTSQAASDSYSKAEQRIADGIYETTTESSSLTSRVQESALRVRSESAARRSQRRCRNADSYEADRRESRQRLNKSSFVNSEENRASETQETLVPCSSESITDKDCADGIVEGYDTADNVDNTSEGILLRNRVRHRVAYTTEISRCSNETVESSISHGKKERIMTEVQQIDFPSISIADRLAALQRRGTTDWKRRVNTETLTVPSGLAKFTVNDTPRNISTQAEKDELASKQQKLAERLEKLESAAEGWRKRVAVPDAVKFSVAGKMKVEQLQIEGTGSLSHLIEVATNSTVEGKKKVPRPERFRIHRSTKEGRSNTVSPEEGLKIPEGSSDPVSEESDNESKSAHHTASILSVPRADDETFTSFFSNVSFAKCEAETLDLAESDFDVVTSFSERLGTRRTVQTQRRRLPSKNPLRILAARTDLKDEYTEITTGVAERVMKSLNVEKLAKKSSLAIEALAGLASTEDFGAVTLKNVTQDSTGYGNRLPPHKDLMLILVKGRRHVQVRLVEPVAASINSGDNYILVTKNELYNYVGKYSNVIERVRGAEIALSIQQNRDLGCRASQVITVSEEKPTCTSEQTFNFWKILGTDAHTVEGYSSLNLRLLDAVLNNQVTRMIVVIDGGHPDEDELYESALMDTNMVYEVVGEDELMPLDKYWGAMPRIEMLDPSKILIFDFGSEMYIWNGKIAPAEKRKVATHLAEVLWSEGYDYTECTVSPISSASIIGRRTRVGKNEKKADVRPSWCLIAKLTQHMETVLFREKFLDWPNVTGIIRVRETEEKEQVDGKIVVEPPDVDSMIDAKCPAVDFVLEGSHLGRGTGWYDDELLRQSVVATTNVTVWHIDEFSYSLLSGSSVGQFYTGDSYIVRWMYTVTITGRGLSGEPSKHASKGRDRCAYFIWQGQKASLNEQGTAALLTVELDQEQGPQIRVVEGFEPAAFLNLFAGRMVVHSGKMSKKVTNKRWRLYIYRGNEESESSLSEVSCSMRQLRSRGSLILIDTKFGKIYVWHGCAALGQLKQNALKTANILKANRPEEAGLSAHIDVTVREINEADDAPAAFFEALGGMNKQLYVPLQNNRIPNHTPRLFHLSSVSGEFAATELFCPHRTDLITPFPFLQNELYQVNQPALFLLDNKDELWLWQGWWPDSGSEDQTGSGAVRWQAERRAAMVMAVRYWKKLHPESDDCPVYLVWAGLEPLAFTNLFPTWTYHDEIAELNIRDGRDSGEVLTVEGELARLMQSTYPPAQLLQRPLPEGVDPTILEKYLSPQHFEELLGMNIEEFEELPAWKQINIKKKIGLF